MDANEYLKKLMLFCKRELVYIIDENTILIKIDNEISYEFNYVLLKAYVLEKNNRSEIEKWNNEKKARIQFAFLIKSSYRADFEYKSEMDFVGCESFDDLEKNLRSQLNSNLLSIGKCDEGKLSLIYNANIYQIFYVSNGQKYLISQSKEKLDAFARFYNELLYLESFMLEISDYEKIFGDSFSESERIEIIGY